MNSATAAANEIDQLRAALEVRDAQLADRDVRIRELELLVDYLRRKPFRPASEALAGMTALFDEAEVDGATSGEETPPKKKVGGYERRTPCGRRPLPPELPRKVVRHELPEGERACACCGCALHEIGVEVTEQLDVVPQTMRVLRHERVKYGCRGCEAGIVTATMPAQPVPKSMASPSLLAHVAVAKYADHLPLYRQEAMWARLGVELDRGTLASWMVRAGELVQGLINLLVDDIKSDGVLCLDETTVQVLREKGKKATSPGYMWAMSRAGPGPRIVVFEYDPSRSGRVAERLLADFHGTVVTDGFDGYKRLAALGITRAGCWAHVRRKFVEAVQIEGKTGRSTVAQRAVELIGRLYAVEGEVATTTAAERLAARQSLSSVVMGDVEAMLDAEVGRVPPKSPTGRALSYLRNEWLALQVFLRDGAVPIDNNRVENAIRPFALGRKNWLFSATPAGARASANLYSLIETAKANGVEPFAYLTRVFRELPSTTRLDEIARLLPYRDDQRMDRGP